MQRSNAHAPFFATPWPALLPTILDVFSFFYHRLRAFFYSTKKNPLPHTILTFSRFFFINLRLKRRFYFSFASHKTHTPFFCPGTARAGTRSALGCARGQLCRGSRGRPNLLGLCKNEKKSDPRHKKRNIFSLLWGGATPPASTHATRTPLTLLTS